MVKSTRNRADSIVKTCRVCETQHTVFVNITDYADWKLGKYIQDAMYYLSADERELLISGTCGDCFDKMFGGEEK